MKIIIPAPLFLHDTDKQRLDTLGEVVHYQQIPKNQEELIQRVTEAHCIIDNNYFTPLTQDVLSKCTQLKFICASSVGVNHIDLEAAKKQGILIANCPGFNAQAVAEFTIGLLISATRFSVRAQQDIKQNIWDPGIYKGKELYKKTMGIIGFGNIGQRIATIAKTAFQMKTIVISADSSHHEFEFLLKESDFIAICTPLTDRTRGMLSDKEFSVMKTGVVIVNTARGAIIDEKALIKNLKNGKVFAAGLDVLSQEPMSPKDPLFSFPNVIITPHIAWNTEEAKTARSHMVVENVQAFVTGKPIHLVY